jgi:hypothetical protein
VGTDRANTLSEAEGRFEKLLSDLHAKRLAQEDPRARELIKARESGLRLALHIVQDMKKRA